MSNLNTVLLKQLASKIGVVEDNIIEKTLEFLRKLNLKSMRLNEPQKIILCLDIACANSGIHFDREIARKLSGVKQYIYNNYRFAVLKLLDIERTVHEVCVQLGCEHISKFADEILQKYKGSDQIERDFTHPQYTVASVVTACAIKNVKISKEDAFALSSLKARQWKQLKDEFMKFAEENNFKTNLKKKRNNVPCAIVQEIEDKADETNNGTDEELVVQEEIVEEYEVWKQRILEEAYSLLGSNT